MSERTRTRDGRRRRWVALAVRPVATVLYSGYAPVAPGTAGSAVAAVAYYGLGAGLGPAGWAITIAIVLLVGVPAADLAARDWGKDPRRVVVDEVAGYLVTVALLPHGFWMAVAGFFVFRVFDIVKPPPIRRLESLPGGWGIVADDVLAGVYGNLLIRAALWLAPHLGIGP